MKSKNPFSEIKKDMVKLSQLAIDNGNHAPDFQQVAVEKSIRKILRKYRFKVRELPNFKATR